MSHRVSCRRSRALWVLAVLLLLGQWVGSHAALAHHARQLLAASPLSQICTAPEAGATGGTTAPITGQEYDVLIACAVLLAAPAPARPDTSPLLPGDPAPAVQSEASDLRLQVVLLPPARAPPTRA